MSRRRGAQRRPDKRALPGGQEGDSAPAERSGSLWKSPALLIPLATSIAIIFVAIVLAFSPLAQQSGEQTPASSADVTPADSASALKAAIVDQLSLTQPSPDFAERATNILEQAGYAVDYYPGEEVTVEFYRNLATHDYDLILLRVHSGLGRESGYVNLFTSEPYSETKYVDEQIAMRFGRARYYEGGPVYFGIMPQFIYSSMKGRFDGTTIIMMGCWGLSWTDMAEAFVQKGAKAVVSWDGLVSADHTDEATERLLEHLVTNGHTVREAVDQTMAEVGPDPAYGSKLLFYPSE